MILWAPWEWGHWQMQLQIPPGTAVIHLHLFLCQHVCDAGSERHGKDRLVAGNLLKQE